MRMLVLAAFLAGSAPAFVEAAPADARGLTDAQVLHVVVAVNQIDVDAGKLARTKGSAREVKAFAERMIAGHDAQKYAAVAIGRRARLKPEDNAVSRSLRQSAREAMGSLRGLGKGATFDRAYLDREVAYHAVVLEALDQSLVPAATLPELRDLLARLRMAVAAHLADARDVQAGLRR